MQTSHTKIDLKHFGIYIIKNTINNDFYIGSTIENFQKRKQKHIYAYEKWLNGTDKNQIPHLYKAMKKYGIENFEFIIYKKFINKKDSKRTKKIITYIEEKYIATLKPKYNICKKPTQGGCPNLGRNLSQEWKDKIREKSKLYRHVGEIYNNKVKQNKKGSSIYKIEDLKGNIFIGSSIECQKYFNVSIHPIMDKYNNINNKSLFFKSVEKLKNQKKKIKLFLEKEEIIFNSYGECDRYLNMWKGFTSTQITNNRKLIVNYKYELINEDIV